MIDEEFKMAVKSCSECGATLPDSIFDSPEPVHCENCGTRFQVKVFPAFFSGPGQVDYGASIQTDDEASCFYHPEKIAVVACESCGRFLCSLCEIDMSGRKICPNCLEIGRNQERIEGLITERTLHDQIALSIALLPLFFIFVTFITAPMAIYFSIRHWRSPSSILPRTKMRFILAIIVASLQMAVWAAVFFPQFLKLTKHL